MLVLAVFITVEQTLDIAYDIKWNNTHSASYLHFYEEFVTTATDLFNLSGFVGININGVKS